MDSQKFAIAEFDPPLATVRDAKSLSFSYNLDLIAVLSKGNEGIVFPYCHTNSQNRADVIWKLSKPISDVAFSEDSSGELVAVLKDGDVQIFSFQNKKRAVTLTSKNLRQTKFLDFSAEKPNLDAKILKFSRHQIILSCPQFGTVVSVEWNENGIWVKDFIISTKRTLIESKIYGQKIYLLSDQGILDIYDANTGQEVNCNINLSQFLKDAACLIKLAVASESVAVTDLNHEIFFISMQHLLIRDKDSPSEVKIAALESCCLEAISFCSSGLAVWYSHQAGGGIFRVYNPNSGNCLHEEFLVEDSKVCMLGYLDCADVFFSPCQIRLNLHGVQKKDLAHMVLERVGHSCLISMLQGDGWQDIDVALPVLTEGLTSRQIEVVRFALKLHNLGFPKHLKPLSTAKNLTSLCANLEQLLQTLVSSIEDNVSSFDYAESLLTLSLNHFYNLLGSIYKILDSNTKEVDSDLHSSLEKNVMKSVVLLRSFLYHPPKLQSKAESSKPVPKELQELNPLMQEIWNEWSELPEAEIIKQAVEKNCIPIANTYFVKAKRQHQRSFQSLYDRVTNDWVMELLKSGKVDQVKTILTKMGKVPLIELKRHLLDTFDDKLQEILFLHLSNLESLSHEELNAAKFLRDVKQILYKYLVPRSDLRDDYVRLSLGFVIAQSELWRKTVLAELFFCCQESEFITRVEAEATWNYLLTINQPDLLNLWVDLCFGSSPPENVAEAIQAKVDCKSNFPDTLLSLFKKWTVNLEMVERVTTADCLTSTKDLVLDHLSTLGIFCSVDKISISSILARFVRSKNLANVRTVLELPTSTVSWKAFSKMLIKFSAHYKIAPLMFSFVTEDKDLWETIESCELPESSMIWLQAWFSMVQLSTDYTTENFIKAIEKNLELLAPGDVQKYLEEQPMIAMALILLKNKHNFQEVLTGSCVDLKAPLTQEVVDSVKRSFPVLEMILTEEAWNECQKPDVTLYELLERGSAFDVPKLFDWQDSNRKSDDETPSKMPSFSKGSPYEKYANNQFINYEYYLKQGRPSFAYCSFIVEEFRQFKKLSKARIKQACNVAHGIALGQFCCQSIAAACISFIEMLGLSSEKARLHVTTGAMILKNMPAAHSKESIGELMNNLLVNREEAASKLLDLLETSLVPNDLNQINTFIPIKNWAVAVRLSKVHNLPMPESLLKFYCQSGMWLHFVICLDLYQYSVEQAFHLVELIESKSTRNHLKHSFLRTSQSPASKFVSPLQPRDIRMSLYSRIGVTEKIIQPSSSNSSADGSSLLAISWSSENSLVGDIAATSQSVALPDFENDLFRCILACHSYINPPHAFLEACLYHNNPFLAVLASCYESCSLVDCLGVWIVSSLSKQGKEIVAQEIGGSLSVWNENSIPLLFLSALRTNHVVTLAISLDVFLPECPLRVLVKFIKNCVVDKCFDEAVDLIQIFKAQCQDLPVAVSEDTPHAFLMQRTWVYRTSVKIVCTALANNFSSSYNQYKFLQALCKSSFTEYITVECPDFTHLLQLQKCLLQTGVTIDYTTLCVARRGSENELQACLQRLVDGSFFTQALEMARIAGLPKEPVVIAQWKKAINEINGTEENIKIWKECQLAFVEAKIQPLVAAEFFHEHVESRKSLIEKYQVLQFAHSWYSLSKQMSVRKRQDCYITKAIEVELEMWRTRLKIDGQSDVDAPLKPKLFCKTRKELFAEAGVGYIDLETKLEDENEIKALDAVIGELLDQGRVASALRLEALFCHKNKDLGLLVTCLSLAESEIMPYQLSSEQRMMMEQSYASSSSFRRRPLYSLRVSSLASMSLSTAGQSSNGSEFVESPPKEKQEVLNAIEKLTLRLQHGKAIGERIAACYRVSMNIDKPYIDIITVEDTVGYMRAEISKDCPNKFALASDLSMAGQISKEDMAAFLKDEILAAVSNKSPVQGGIFWGYELDSSFHLVLELSPDPVLLGKQLLAATRDLRATSPSANIKKTHGIMVELLIRAHDCFTAACDMEGIEEVLLKTRSFNSHLLQHQEWQLMVRLVTGIRRYNDMVYIFQILKENDQFECLLGKGMDKVPGLQTALIDFVRSKCGENRDLLQIVALHFRLYTEVAEIWEADAKDAIGRLLSMTAIELGIAITATKYKPKPKQPTPEVLKASTDLGVHLKSAMQSYTHAAEYYLQANKLSKAMECASQAELIALQISFTIGVANGHTLDCLLGQEQTQVSILVMNRLTFPQAVIVAKAYSHPVDWGSTLYHHCVLKKEQQYLTDFMKVMTLTPALVEDISKRFQNESSINSDMAKVMKQIVNNVKSVEVKYRIASQLGFKDILENMISGADLPYLRDTVWRRGTKHY
ncbi:Hypothetical predicted protein [Cloeon dipterum]|uniref:Spatacsin C-terminal domain-containing protein n=1 Tax=Cloeon dipterum TaxID=197152 RepID=A0A8S1DJ19_9INSE|nr:Hypothetical predicted protein [Cloeon dipterum]